jgi:hypothetical protein
MSDSKASSSSAHQADAKGGTPQYTSDSKGSSGDHKSSADDSKGGEDFADCPRVEVHTIELEPKGCVPIHAPLELKIGFELERDLEDAYWQVFTSAAALLRRCAVMLLQCCTAVMLRGGAAVLLWCCGAVAIRSGVRCCCDAVSVTLLLWRCGAVVLWCCGTVVLWCLSAVVVPTLLT